MRFLTMVKSKENNVPPPQAMMDAMEKLVEKWTKGGTMITGGGLAPTAQSTRVRFSGGKVAVIDGPFTEAKEVVGGFAIMEFESKEAAVEESLHVTELHKTLWPGWEGETEIRQIFGSEDFDPNFMKK